MLRKLRNKWMGRSGFTLAETLMTVLILLMVTAVIAGGVPAAVKAYDKVIIGANAQVLLSTATTRLREELGAASKVSVSAAGGEAVETVIDYTSADGSRSRIYLVNEATTKRGINLWQYRDIYTKDDAETKYGHLLVSQAASNRDRLNSSKSLYILYDSVSFTGGVVTFTNLRVMNDDARITGLVSFSVNVIASLS